MPLNLDGFLGRDLPYRHLAAAATDVELEDFKLGGRGVAVRAFPPNLSPGDLNCIVLISCHFLFASALPPFFFAFVFT